VRQTTFAPVPPAIDFHAHVTNVEQKQVLSPPLSTQ
jgi:hypothetical protein